MADAEASRFDQISARFEQRPRQARVEIKISRKIILKGKDCRDPYILMEFAE